MRIDDLVWLPDIIEKLSSRHYVEPDEVEEVLANSPHVRFGELGNVAGEDLYRAFGRTNAGRHLAVFFVYKKDHHARYGPQRAEAIWP